MKILHFAETIKGGPATHLNALLPFQVGIHDVSVLIPERDKEQIAVAGVRVKTFQDTSRTISGILSLRQAIASEINGGGYDVVHLHSTFAGFVGRTVRKSRHQRTIYCSRGWAFAMDVSPLKKKIYGFIERVLAHRSDFIINISNSEQAAALEHRLPKEKMKVVYNGIADTEWEPLPDTAPMRRLLFVGRYDRQKGLDVLIAAMPALAKLGFRLKAVGAPVLGDDNVTLSALVDDLGWRSSTEIREQMRECDIVVMPSRWEGFGFVAAEALRAGRPVVGTEVGGLQEIVLDGIVGALCPPDSAESLSAAIIRASKMSPASTSAACRARYESMFAASRMAEEIEELYKRPLTS